ncbi:MAG TPA: VWA domain-containing protein [Terriglobia bacterium]|nr:VWA domain-containing protein [Terriglobia bacterium]
MRLRAAAGAVLLMAMTWCASLAAAQTATNPPPGFKLKVDVNLVLVEAIVRDAHGGLVGNLDQGDFHVLEDGVEQQVRYFSRDELPLAVALVVDASGSMAPVLKELRQASYDATSQLKPSDQVALFDFRARAERLEDLTTNRRRIAFDISRIHAAGATVIPDALYEAADYLGDAAPTRRHAIILISDNDNTLRGYANESRVIRRALETETVIYSIRIHGGLSYHLHHLPVLLPLFQNVSVPTIAHETGGEVMDAQDPQALHDAIATVISRLKQRYTLGYQSTNTRHDGAFRRIEIRVGPPSDQARYKVYARQGYYAPAGEQTAWRDTQP